MDAADRCPCLSGLQHGECCAPLHAGVRTAPTAEALMRSRYSAYVVGDVAYLLETWDASTRPAVLDLDPDVRWMRLDIEQVVDGGPFDREGTVRFAAHWRRGGERGAQRESSRFVRADRWRYVDGE